MISQAFEEFKEKFRVEVIMDYDLDDLRDKIKSKIEAHKKELETEVIYYESEKITKAHNIYATQKNMKLNKVILGLKGQIKMCEELLK